MFIITVRHGTEEFAQKAPKLTQFP